MRVSTQLFTYDAAKRQFTTEISDLGREFNFEQVYTDAIDTGLTLVSQRTGREVEYVVDHVEFDQEGDRLWWDLVVADPRHLLHTRDVSAMQNMRGSTIRIFND